MSPDLRRQFIQFIIHSPPISKELMDFLVQWSGNPFYLSELLRLLFHPDNSTYLTCVKGEQHVAVGINLETMLPKTIADVILERMQLELPEILDLAQVLSVAGLEFPELLADTLRKKCFPKRNIQNNIQQLIQAGVLIQKSNHFAFDHQVKQETIYNSLEKKQQQEIYMHLVEILLTTQIYENPQAQQQHLAHYLIHCPDSFQQEHIQKILDAARNAFNQRQFEPAQTFYNALIKQKNLKNMDGIECLIERSRLYQLRGWYDQANSDLKTAEKIIGNYVPKSRSEKKQKHQLNIRIKKAMGHNLLKQRSMENADTILLQARREIYGFLGIKHRFQSKTLSCYKDLVEIECDLAACFLRRKEFTKCKQTCEKARKLAMHAENKWPAHSLLHEVNIALGDLYASRKGESNASNALNYYKTALQNTCEDPYYQGQILLKIADVNKKIKQFDEAQKQYTDALTIQKKISNFYGQAMAHAGLGDIYLHKQEFEESRYQWEHVSHLQVDIGMAALKNRCNMALCRIYFYKKLYPRAAKYWWDARTNDSSQTQTDDHLELLETLFSYFQEQGDDEKAYYCLQDLEIRISDERSKKWFETIIQLSDICLRTSRIKEAQTNLEMILDRATDPGIKAQAHERMGDIFAMSSENATEQIPENDMDGLEWHYQQAIHFQLMSNNPQHSVKLFNRLIQAMSNHPEDLIRLPQIFQAMMQDLSLTKHFFHREMTND
jgi:hypothetical protein